MTKKPRTPKDTSDEINALADVGVKPPVRVRLDPLLSTGQYEWSTPIETFSALHAEFGFTLDVCAASWNAKCQRYFTASNNGLEQEWDGICWMNPPYGRQIRQWMKKAYESSTRGATVVCLVPARTDTAWWHEYAMQGEIRFLRGRQYFKRKDGTSGRAPFPCAVVVFVP